jgi:FeS assembly SUF system protein
MAMSDNGGSGLSDQVVAALRRVHDPEIPVNIYDLGLIYALDVSETGSVHVAMTLTAPNCPVADQIVADVRAAVSGVDGVQAADVQLVWQPAWSPERMSEIARLELAAMGIDPDRAKEKSGPSPSRLTVGGRPPARGGDPRNTPH